MVTVTSPARTVADCLRHLPPRVSVPIADAAAAQGVDPASVGRILDWQERWPYVDRGRRSAELIDGRRESWLETQSAIAHHELGLAAATPQMVLLDERGRAVARVDFLWPEQAVVGEADGWDKYRVAEAEAEAEADAQAAERGLVSLDALKREKDREDRIRDLGYQVVRWGTADAMSPHTRLRGALNRAFARGGRADVRGSVRPTLRQTSGAPTLVRIDELRAMAAPRPLLAAPRCSSSAGHAS